MQHGHAADEFRVESRVFAIGPDEAAPLPLSHTTTCFVDGRVIDIRHGTPREAMILRPKVGRMTILDFERKVVCELSADEMLRAVAAIVARVENKPATVRFAADPKFKVAWPNSTEVRLTATPLSYRVLTRAAPSSSVAANYREFADWMARWSTTSAGGMPPFARISLNREVASRNQLPIRVEYQSQAPAVKLYSTHEFETKLRPADRSELETVDQAVTRFKHVDLVEFRVHAADRDSVVARHDKGRESK